jgi:hypothetical protein
MAVAGPADMPEHFTREESAHLKATLQRVIDSLLFFSDEVETDRLPVHDPASALRLAAKLFALERELI